MRTLIAILVLCALSGCASITALPAPVKLTAQDAAPVAKTIADIIGRRLPPGSGAVRLDPPMDETGKAVADQIIQLLKARGYAVDDTPRAMHRIGFAITPLKAGALLTVTIDGGLATLLLSRDAAGTVTPASGLSFREAAQ